MKKETLNQLEAFEIFVERMEAWVENVMQGERSEKYNRNDFDLRTFNGASYTIPNDLQDYMNLWKVVQKDLVRVKKMWEDDDFSRNDFFFDLYWNDKLTNTAYYEDEVFWVFYDYDNGVVYELPSDEEKLTNAREWVKWTDEAFSQIWIER